MPDAEEIVINSLVDLNQYLLIYVNNGFIDVDLLMKDLQENKLLFVISREKLKILNL